MNDIYTADYFLRKFTSIPEELWCIGNYTDPKDPCKHCALGLCGAREKGPMVLGEYEEVHTAESHYLMMMVLSELGWPFTVSRINDRQTARFPQETPKQRILAALRYIKDKQSQNYANNPNPTP